MKCFYLASFDEQACDKLAQRRHRKAGGSSIDNPSPEDAVCSDQVSFNLR